MNRRKKETLSKGKLAKLLCLALVIVAGLAGLLQLAKSKVSEQFADSDIDQVENSQVSKGAISTTVSGSGTLSYEAASEIVIPQSVDLTEVYVSEGQNVEAHEMLAAVNSASVLKSMADTQTSLEEIDKEIQTLIDDAASSESEIKTNLAGRVKKIYAELNEDINTVMYDHQALMILSLDGKMAIDLDTDSLKVGDAVTLTDSDGKEYSGSCDSVWAGKATVCISDNGPALDDEMTATLAEGKKSGKLYIHQPLAITGYSGKVSAIKVSENQSIAKDTVLLTLTESQDTVSYASLLSERAKLEETLKNLVVIYKEGAVYAKEAGRITSYAEASASSTTTQATDTIFAISPTERMTLTLNVDETDILSLKVGQEAAITIEAIGEETYPGKITSIDTNGDSADGVTSFTATLSLEKEEGMLSGMSASAVVTIEGKEDALLVPSQAIRQTRDTTYVYSSYDETSGELGGMVEVVTGLSNGRYTEIVSGLEEGMTVYYKQASQSDSNTNYKGNRGEKGNFPGGTGIPGNFGGNGGGYGAPGSNGRNGSSPGRGGSGNFSGGSSKGTGTGGSQPSGTSK